jgi:arylsulfatase B
MVSIMDESVGDLIQMLKQRNLWDDTLVIVTADNGGETRSGGNNFPLRSQKWSLYEGGVHVNSFINGGLVKNKVGS